MRRSLDAGWAGIGIIIILLMLFGCATFSIKAPTTQMLLQTAIHEAGYEIGKWDKAIAEEIIYHSKIGEKVNVLVLYENWKRYLAYRIKDPSCRRLVVEMLKLVDFDLKFKPDSEKIEIIRELFSEFVVGLNDGVAAGDAPS